jgi:hypothetical protein
MLVWAMALLLAGTAIQYLLKLKLWNQLNSAAVVYRSLALGILAISTIYLDKTQFVSQLNPVFAAVKSNELNLRDKMTLTNGYYESVINKNRNLDTKLAEVEKLRPDTWEQLVKTPASKDTANLLSYTLIPNSSITFKEKPFRVNQFGFRDLNYTIQKPDSTTRIAFLGGSVELGSGVSNQEVFEQVTEQMLQDSIKDWNYEILNFAIAGYGLIHHYENTKKGSRIYRHRPDLVLLAVHKSDAQFVQRGLINILRKDTWQQDSLMSEIILRLELDKSMSDNEIYARLRPHLKSIINTLLATIKNQIKDNGCNSAMLFVPETEMRFKEAKNYDVPALAKENGFEIVSLDGAYNGMESIDLQVTEFDHHPNALAHKLLATKFFEAIVKNDRIFKPFNTKRENS